MKCKLDKWQSGSWHYVIVVVIWYVQVPFNLLDQSQMLLHKKRYSSEIVFKKLKTHLEAN